MPLELSAASVSVLGMGLSFFVVFLMFLDRRHQARLWRDTLAYMKAKTTYEAEDAIDREDNRSKGVIQKVLAERRKKAQNLSEPNTEDDDISELKQSLEQAYDKDTRAKGVLP